MTADLPNRRLLNSREAARYLNVCPRMLWSLQNCGSVPSLRIGRRVLFDVRDLDAWIDSRKSVRK